MNHFSWMPKYALFPGLQYTADAAQHRVRNDTERDYRIAKYDRRSWAYLGSSAGKLWLWGHHKWAAADETVANIDAITCKSIAQSLDEGVTGS